MFKNTFHKSIIFLYYHPKIYNEKKKHSREQKFVDYLLYQYNNTTDVLLYKINNDTIEITLRSFVNFFFIIATTFRNNNLNINTFIPRIDFCKRYFSLLNR